MTKFIIIIIILWVNVVLAEILHAISRDDIYMSIFWATFGGKMGVATTRAPMGLGPQDLHKKLLHLSQPLSSKCFENSKPEIPLQICSLKQHFSRKIQIFVPVKVILNQQNIPCSKFTIQNSYLDMIIDITCWFAF